MSGGYKNTIIHCTTPASGYCRPKLSVMMTILLLEDWRLDPPRHRSRNCYNWSRRRRRLTGKQWMQRRLWGRLQSPGHCRTSCCRWCSWWPDRCLLYTEMFSFVPHRKYIAIVKPQLPSCSYVASLGSRVFANKFIKDCILFYNNILTIFISI